MVNPSSVYISAESSDFVSAFNDRQSRGPINWEKSTKTHYYAWGSFEFIVNYMHLLGFAHDHLYDTDRIRADLHALGVIRNVGWYVMVNKRRLRKHFKTAMARAKVSRKGTQKEHDRIVHDYELDYLD